MTIAGSASSSQVPTHSRVPARSARARATSRFPRLLSACDRCLSACNSRAATSAMMEEAFAASLRVVAASMRAGIALDDALATAAARCSKPEVTRALMQASTRMHAGMSTRSAMERFARELPIEGAALLGTLLAVQARSGGDPGESCHRLAQVLHERARLRKEAASATAMARFAARAVILLPIFAALGWLVINPTGATALLNSGGWILLVPTFVGLLVGGWAIRKVANDSTSFGSLRGKAASGLLRRLAGSDVPVRQSQVRLMVMLFMPILGLTLLVGGGVLTWSLVTVVGIACWRYPSSVREADRAAVEEVVARGLPELLELTIAFVSAGATPREALRGALHHGTSELCQMLDTVRSGVSLGRSPASSYAACKVAGVSHSLDSWAFALTAGDRLGAPALNVLETLLIDARSTLREQFRQRAATSGPRMQLITVLIIVPSVLWAVLALTSLGLARQLTSSGLL